MPRDTDEPKPIPLKRARELFDLDSATGALRRRITRGRGKAGADAVRFQWDPRFQEMRCVVWIDKEKFQAPRVILSLHQGRPVSTRRVVDHVNGDPLDNRPANLREVTRTQNQLNRVDNRGSLLASDLVDPW